MKKLKMVIVLLWLTISSGAQTRDHRYNGKWVELPATNAKDVSINEKGIIYMVGTNGILYNYTGTEWIENGKDKLATYAEFGTMKFKVFSNGLMAKYYQGYDLQRGELVKKWNPITGSDAVDLAVTNYIKPGTGTPFTQVVMVNTVGKIYQYNTYTEIWNQLTGSDGARVAAGGAEVWLVNTIGKVYRYTNPTKYNPGKWEEMPGSKGKDISIAHDGTKWLITTDGKIHKWYGTGWAELTGFSGAHRIAANNGKAVVINTSGKLYQLDY
jgi:hypothetical protein